jgi:hypothetical protein
VEKKRRKKLSGTTWLRKEAMKEVLVAGETEKRLLKSFIDHVDRRSGD